MKNFFSLILLALILVGCGTEASSLTLSDAVSYLRDQDIELVEPEDIHPDFAFAMTLNEVEPTVYSVNEDNEDEVISIYVFESEADVELAVEDFEYKTATSVLDDHEFYEIHNLLIFYVFGGREGDPLIVNAIENIEQ